MQRKPASGGATSKPPRDLKSRAFKDARRHRKTPLDHAGTARDGIGQTLCPALTFTDWAMI